MFRHLLTLSIGLLAILSLDAQIIDPEKKIFSEDPFFNSEFIRQHKIKTISGEHFIKPDHNKMSPKGIWSIYEFSENGQMTRQITRYRMPGGETDTSFIYYEYDDAGRLATKRTTDNFGFFSLSFSYDDKGSIIEETFNRELNASASNGNFKLARQYPMGIERYEINYITPTFYKKKYLNSLGTPFKEVSYAFNEKGKIIEETGTLLTTRMLERKTFKYDEKGKLIEKTEYSDVARNVDFLFKYSYDNKGNLLEISKVRNAETVLITEFMLDEKGLLNAKLSRDVAAKMIDIVRFSYEFY